MDIAKNIPAVHKHLQEDHLAFLRLEDHPVKVFVFVFDFFYNVLSSRKLFTSL